MVGNGTVDSCPVASSRTTRVVIDRIKTRPDEAIDRIRNIPDNDGRAAQCDLVGRADGFDDRIALSAGRQAVDQDRGRAVDHDTGAVRR